MSNIITRFPPSPTGMLHVGSLRTALYAYLVAKQAGGTFVMRIEDTDRERLVEGAVENFLHSMAWGGIVPDEGVMIQDGKIIQKGDVGPYVQSERKEQGMYQQYIQQLLDAGHAYYAFDTPEELTAMREDQQAAKQAPRYDREKMKNQFTLGAEEVKAKIDAGEPYVVRLKVPREGSTTFKDVIRGEVTIENAQVDDQVLMKADGYPTYHFAVVVDDHLMNVTHVIRGEEWISSVPKHVLLYQAFGWELPIFAHLPLLVNEKKQKLSKRHGDVSVEDFKEQGYLPEALVNFIAFLGWNPGTEQEIFSLAELEKEFSLEKVGKSAAVFNREKLDWYNQQYLRKLSTEELAERCRPFYNNAGVNVESKFLNLEEIVALEQERAKTLQEIVENTGFIFAEQLEYDAELLVWKKGTREDAKKYLGEVKDFLESQDDWGREVLEDKTLAWIKENGWGNGDVLWPLRVALSGKAKSPGPLEIAAVLKKETTMSRIEQAIAKL